MGDTLEILLALQDVDFKIDQGKKKIAKKEEEIAAINKQLENLKINLEEKKRYFEKARLKLAQEELELQEVEEKLKTTKNKLYSGEISSPKELSQWERTVEKLEENKNSLENIVIASLESTEELHGEIQRKTQSYLQQEESLSLLLTQLQEELSSEERSVLENKKERERIIASLPQEVLSIYEELRRKFPNPVVRLNGETCEGCNLTVPLAVVRAVRKKEELVRCPNCGRFLHRK